MNQKIYWNNAAENKEFTTPFHFNEFSKYVSVQATILDVGCGYGRTLDQLYCNGYKNLIGIDFSEKMIERGKELYPYLDLRVKTDKSINLPSKSCDAVILFAVLTCIVDDKEQLELISEIERVLKPGGAIYINDFILNTDERNINRYNKFEVKYGKYGVFELPEGALVRHHSKDWIKTITGRFNKLVYEDVVFTTMNGNKSNGFYFLGRKKEGVIK